MAVLAQTDPAKTAAHVPDLAELQTMAARFAPTELKVDTSRLSPGDQKALVKLVEAARLFDDIFMTQYWSGDHALYAKLQKDTSPLGKARLHYFWINKGPWSELDGNTAFLPGVPDAQAAGRKLLSRGHDQGAVRKLGEDAARESSRSRPRDSSPSSARDGKNGSRLFRTARPIRTDLTQCAKLLNEAAALTDNASLKQFLNTRAAAFLSNDYYESDVAWMDLDAPLDITIGPYETYNDEIFGYKAAYEAYINVRDDEESPKLGAFSKHLQEIENNLPIDPEVSQSKDRSAGAHPRGERSDATRATAITGCRPRPTTCPTTSAWWPQKGSKRVMLKNVQQAKFQQHADSDLQAGAGGGRTGRRELRAVLHPHPDPRTVPRAGPASDHGEWARPTTPRRAVEGTLQRDRGSQGRRDRAVRVAVHDRPRAGDGPDSVLKTDANSEKQLYTTYLASSFRTLRFGLDEAHGKGMAMQVNYLIDKGGHSWRVRTGPSPWTTRRSRTRCAI